MMMEFLQITLKFKVNSLVQVQMINIIWNLLHVTFIMMEFLQITLKFKVNSLVQVQKI